MELAPQQIFAGRYRVERLLARGGMGAVYVAQQLSTEAPVALKVLDPAVLQSREQLRAFKLEATVAGRVRSDHIVRTLDAGQDDDTGLPYLVMELLDGTPLDELVERDGPLPAETVALYMTHVAAGLDRAHGYSVDGQARPIVHRDLKPNNLVLIHRDSGAPEVKILDFGIAKVLGQTTGVTQNVKGTPSFMAYEQAAGETVTPQTDIWAMGLIAFYLLTGTSYWRSASSPDGTLHSLLAEVLTLPLQPATERAKELGTEPAWPTEAFDAWFARCVDRAPGRRFSSAGQAARALRQALLGVAAPELAAGAGDTPEEAFEETVFAPSVPTPAVMPSGEAATTTRAAVPERPVAQTTDDGRRDGPAARPRWPLAVGVALLLCALGLLLWLRGAGQDVTPVAGPASTQPAATVVQPEPPAAPAAAEQPPKTAAPAPPAPGVTAPADLAPATPAAPSPPAVSEKHRAAKPATPRHERVRPAPGPTRVAEPTEPSPARPSRSAPTTESRSGSRAAPPATSSPAPSAIDVYDRR